MGIWLMLGGDDGFMGGIGRRWWVVYWGCCGIGHNIGEEECVDLLGLEEKELGTREEIICSYGWEGLLCFFFLDGEIIYNVVKIIGFCF